MAKITQHNILRLGISLGAIVLPIALLVSGIYGSFVFTFSIPLLWQIGFLGKPLTSLGLRGKLVKSSMTAGLLTGCLLGFLGGYLLKVLGITGYVYSAVDQLKLSAGIYEIAFPLQKELGYRLLTASNSPVGLLIYLLFCIFLIGLGEEIFWRGFLQQKFASRMSVRSAIWLTALLFALTHFYIFAILPINLGLCFLILIGLAGVVWGYLFRNFNNLWVSVFSHGMTAFIIWKYYFFKA
ncbi:MAG: type II CAAX endopeptidase family protein [Candidatus Omnitrophota bacterium]